MLRLFSISLFCFFSLSSFSQNLDSLLTHFIELGHKQIKKFKYSGLGKFEKQDSLEFQNALAFLYTNMPNETCSSKNNYLPDSLHFLKMNKPKIILYDINNDGRKDLIYSGLSCGG